jgi:hypothetical protein
VGPIAEAFEGLARRLDSFGKKGERSLQLRPTRGKLLLSQVHVSRRCRGHRLATAGEGLVTRRAGARIDNLDLRTAVPTLKPLTGWKLDSITRVGRTDSRRHRSAPRGG